MIYNSRIKNLVIFLIIYGLILPIFSFAQVEPISPPETLEETKGWLERAWETIKKNLPGILEKIWKEEVLPVWKRMWEWSKVNIWSKIEILFKREIEKRKSIFEEGVEKEKEELKKEIKEEVIPKASKSLWERFKELIK